MLRRSTQLLIKTHNKHLKNFSINSIVRAIASISNSSGLSELPRNPKSPERKPLVTSINELKRRGRQRRKERKEVREFVVKPPENGLLVKSLIPVAHQVFDARKDLYRCISVVLESIPVHVCR